MQRCGSPSDHWPLAVSACTLTASWPAYELKPGMADGWFMAGERGAGSDSWLFRGILKHGPVSCQRGPPALGEQYTARCPVSAARLHGVTSHGDELVLRRGC